MPAQQHMFTAQNLPKTAVIKIAVLFDRGQGVPYKWEVLVRNIISAAQKNFNLKGLGTQILLEVVG